MRHSATRSLLERDDVIIVASVSCIYGIGSVETYTAMTFQMTVGDRLDQRALLADLVAQQYKRQDINFVRGSFRVRGDTIEIFPPTWRIAPGASRCSATRSSRITEFDPLTGQKTGELKSRQDLRQLALRHAAADAQPGDQVDQGRAAAAASPNWRKAGRLLEAQRLEQRTRFDLEMLEATGSCAGIENYSRYLTGRRPGDPPPTLFEYIPDNALVFVDESHVTIPQIGGMYRGDFRRKATLAEYGFRLPSCMDNRPLALRGMGRDAAALGRRVGDARRLGDGTGRRRLRRAGHPPDRPDRPAGRGAPGQDARSTTWSAKSATTTKAGYRTLVTVLTKRMAEDLTEYLHENGVRVRYMHSDIETLERIEILRDLRLGALRRAGRHQPLARGPRHSRMRLRRHPRRRQGRFSALRNVADPDHRPRRPQRRRQGHPLCRPGHRLDGAGDGRDQPPPREAARLERGERHHARKRQVAHLRHPGLGLREGPRPRRHLDFAADGNMVGNNLKAHLEFLQKKMRDAAADLNFEEGRAAARRDQAAAPRWNCWSPTIRWRATSRRRALRAAAKRASTTRAWPSIAQPEEQERFRQLDAARAAEAAAKAARPNLFRKPRTRRDGRRRRHAGEEAAFRQTIARRHGSGHRHGDAGRRSVALAVQEAVGQRSARLRLRLCRDDGRRPSLFRKNSLRRDDRAPHREAGRRKGAGQAAADRPGNGRMLSGCGAGAEGEDDPEAACPRPFRRRLLRGASRHRPPEEAHGQDRQAGAVTGMRLIPVRP